jgi:hypothetical protein
MIFTRPKRRMKSYLVLFGVLLTCFSLYMLIRDKLFDNSDMVMVQTEKFEVPAPTSIEIRQAPLYPERVISPSGPNSPNQAGPENEMVHYSPPAASDPYSEPNESSDIPENLRYPERSFRPPPTNNNTSIAVHSGVASNQLQVSSDNSQGYQTEMIQGGGEFMPGIFANDTFNDNSFSSF